MPNGKLKSAPVVKRGSGASASSQWRPGPTRSFIRPPAVRGHDGRTRIARYYAAAPGIGRSGRRSHAAVLRRRRLHGREGERIGIYLYR